MSRDDVRWGMRSLSIKALLRLLGGTLICFILAIAGLAVVQSRSVLRATEHAADVTDVTIAAMGLEKDFASLERDVFRATAETSPATIKAARENMAEFLASAEAVDTIIENPERQEQIDLITAAAARYGKQFAILTAQLEAGDRLAAFGTIGLLGREGDSIDAAIEVIRESGRAELAKVNGDQVDLTGSALQLALWLGGAAVASGLVLSYVMSGAIRRPIEAVTAALARIADGDYSADIANQGRRDEIGALARAAAILRERGRDKDRLDSEKQRADQDRARVVAVLGDALEALAAGDLTRPITSDFPHEFTKLRTDYNLAVEKLRSTLEAVTSRVANVTTGINEIAAASDDLAARTERQAAGVEETATAIEQLTRTVAETASNVRRVSERAQSARNAADSGNATAREAVSAMEKLAASSEKIVAIIGLIEGIAFQTNLLALNAGVEAARAGDAGKGFAVVANEVRALAQRSSDAAEEVRRLIATSGQQVAAGVELVGRCSDGLSLLLDESVGVAQLATEIAAAAHQQSASLAQINAAVGEMGSTTQQNAAMVEQTHAATASLAEDVVQLSSDVSFFETGGRPMTPARPHPRSAALGGRPRALSAGCAA